jgi:hypothetical protein
MDSVITVVVWGHHGASQMSPRRFVSYDAVPYTVLKCPAACGTLPDLKVETGPVFLRWQAGKLLIRTEAGPQIARRSCTDTVPLRKTCPPRNCVVHTLVGHCGRAGPAQSHLTIKPRSAKEAASRQAALSDSSVLGRDPRGGPATSSRAQTLQAASTSQSIAPHRFPHPKRAFFRTLQTGASPCDAYALHSQSSHRQITFLGPPTSPRSRAVVCYAVETFTRFVTHHLCFRKPR